MLDKEKKLELVRKLSKENSITAYAFGKNSKISSFTARQILNGETENPSETTLNAMLEYIEDTLVGKDIPGHKNYMKNHMVVNEKEEPYQTKNTEVLAAIENLEKILLQRVNILSEAMAETLLNTDQIIDQGKDAKKGIKKLKQLLLDRAASKTKSTT